jgi:predicted dithiol-disulfide oxidoreductase (DUF899 family)
MAAGSRIGKGQPSPGRLACHARRRAPWASIERFRARMGWPVPWYSSLGSLEFDEINDG